MVGRPQPLQRLPGAGVPAAAAQQADLVVQRLLDQRVAEPQPARLGLLDQAGDQRGVEAVERLLLVQVADVEQHVDVDLAALHGGQPEQRVRARGQPRDPAADDVADAFRDGLADVAAGAGQPGGLADVERVAVGARHDGVDDLGGELGGGDPAYQLGGVGVVQAGEVEPQRLVPGQGGQRGRERLGDLRRAVGAEHEQRRVGELGKDVDEQGERLVVRAVQVVEDDEQRRGATPPRGAGHRPRGAAGTAGWRCRPRAAARGRRAAAPAPARSRRAGRAPPGSTGRAAGRPRPRGSGPTRRPSRPASRPPPRPASTSRRRARRPPAPPAAPGRGPPGGLRQRRQLGGPPDEHRRPVGRRRRAPEPAGRGAGRRPPGAAGGPRWRGAAAWSRMSASSCRTAGLGSTPSSSASRRRRSRSAARASACRPLW